MAGLSLAVAAVVLGPMLRPGYPLRFDLVSVPRPFLGEDALGLGDRLPRAIPLDSAVAVLATVLPDTHVTQLLALLALTLAGCGAARLTDTGLAGRLVAALVAIWNPFVMEQLAIGHVPHLLAYGAMPWAGIRGYRLGRGDGQTAWAWAGLTLAVGLASLTPGGGVLGVLAGVAGLLAGAARSPRSGGWSRVGVGTATASALQLPWTVSAALHPGFSGTASGDAAGVTAFALRSETGLGRWVDALGLGGMWNASALPVSRGTSLALLSTVLLLGLALSGLPRVLRHPDAERRVQIVAAGVVAALGYLVAILPVLPGGASALEALIGAVPGAGLLRDGHRWLAPWALATAVLAGHGVIWLADAARRRGRDRAATRTGLRAAAAVLAGLLVVATMPDLGWGLAGRLAARRYPAEWVAVRNRLDAAPDRARVLVLPWQPFRRFAWTGPDAVLDPAPRMLPRQTIVSDALTVSTVRLPEEGVGARRVQAALTDSMLSDAELRAVDVGWVLVERGTPGTLPRLPADFRPVLDTDGLVLLRGPDPLPSAPGPDRMRAGLVIGAHAAAAGLLVLAAGAALMGARRRRPRDTPRIPG